MSVETQATLLERLREQADPAAWEEFFRRYRPFIHECARRRGCSEHTAEELVQDVLLTVYERRADFHYDPGRGRFRDWLSRVVRNLVSRHRRAPAQRIRGVGGSAEQAELADSAIAPDAAWLAAYEDALLQTSLEVVRREVQPETYQAFELVMINELSGAQAAAITGLSCNAVYLARKRVLARLHELGATYRDDGELHQSLRRALQSKVRVVALSQVTAGGDLSMAQQ